jgi:hypothetical protein
LRHAVSAEVYRTREIERVLNVPASLLVAALLVVVAYVIASPLVEAVALPCARLGSGDPLGLALGKR